MLASSYTHYEEICGMAQSTLILCAYDKSSLHEFFWLFTNGNTELPECWKKMMKLVGNEEYSYEKLRENNPPYSDMNEFLKSVR